MARRKNTRLEILQVAMHLFLKDGYTNTFIPQIAKEVGISKGNLAYHFPTKEHLLAELVKELCEFQWQVMEQEVAEGKSSLLSYLLELATMASICDENPVAKDFYVSAYIHPLSLKIIRENDTQKAMRVFEEYCTEWTETDFIQAENVVSGIEYAMFMTENADKVSLEQRIASSLDAIMKIYELPKVLRQNKLTKVITMDYRNIGQKILREFCNYVEEKNVKELQETAK